LALGLASLGAGCAGESSGSSDADRCPDQCERGKKCPGVMQTNQSCDDICLGNDAVAVQSNCHDQYVKSVNCLADLEDICTGLTDCKDEIVAAQTCEHNYCQAHQGEEVCLNVP
jgi:hypothetical protein